ncbi:MAG: alcohol dehydrogenase catalytic domain-containing protein [Actinomycetota bacterium]|nr:alcohol dehydrogenase catalytic domain-containing protein [Actinomycetota bacterium]
MKGVAKLARGAGHVAYTERPDAVAGPGEVVIELLAAGICGTDLHIEAGEYPCLPPVTMGHEFCGRVVELGPAVDAAWGDARVTSETFFSTCGVCRWCRAGRPSICPHRVSLGSHVDGAFAPRIRVPVGNLHRVPEALSDRAAAICEPLACVCNSLSDPASVDAGDEVLVIGPGAIGLLAAQVARASGGRVHLRGAPSDEARLELARSLGFETSTADQAFAGNAPDVVVECSGAGPAITTALEVITRGGTLVQMGLRGAPVTVPFDEICFKELRVRSGFAANPVAWRRALRLLADGAIQLEPLISGAAELADFERLFARSRAADGVKFVLVP